MTTNAKPSKEQITMLLGKVV